MSKVLIAFTSLLVFSISVSSQTLCGFDELHQKRLSSDLAYKTKVTNYDFQIKNYIQNHPLSLNRSQTTLYTIPVVVHVMHTGGVEGSIYNPSTSQITEAIDYLNQVYNGTYPGTQGAGDLQIQFALAKRTPNQNCSVTNGIDRINASSIPNYTANGVNVYNSNGCTELTLKNFARWNVSDYYNIWLVNKIDGNDGTSIFQSYIDGFARFPADGPSLDGAVILATHMKAEEKVLSHEIGHALSLYHVFEGSTGSTNCPNNTDCLSDGDKVCDTDPITNNQSSVCRTGVNTCSGNNYTSSTESNYMNYTGCYTLFTNGQKARMQAAMTLPERASLVRTNNLALTSCPDITIFNPTISPVTITAGNTVTVSFAEDNIGLGSAGPNYVNFHISSDNILTPGLNGDLYLDQYFVNQTLAGASQTILLNKQLTIPTTLGPGNYYIFYAADGTGVVNESNESNNIVSVLITVTVAPDLVIQDAIVSPTKITPGSQATISCKNKNQGTANAVASTTAIWLSKNQTFEASTDINLNADLTVPALTAGQISSTLSRQITIPSGTTPGSWYIMFGADALEQVNEGSSELNNQVFIPITISSAPVCTAPSVTTHPTSKTITAPTSTSFSISASGSDNLYQWQVYIGSSWSNVVNNAPYSGAYSTTLNISSTSAGMSNYQYRCKISSSCTTATATSNPATLIVNASSAACNNDFACQPKAISINSTCILTSCTTIGATPPTSNVSFASCVGQVYNPNRYDDDVWFSITPTTSNPVTIKVIPTSNLANFDIVAGLYIGTCTTLSQNGCADNNPAGYAEDLVFTPVAGYTYLIRVFSYGTSSANSGNFDICVTAAGATVSTPDLEIDNVTLSSLEICPGGSFQVEYNVKNNGNVSANSSTVKYYLSSNSTYSANDILLGSNSVASISGGSNISKIKSLNVPAGTANGNWYVLIIADADNEITEGSTGEANNVYSKQVSVTNCSLADIKIIYTGTPPTTGSVGSNVPVTFACTNIGGTVTPSTRVGFYLSTDNTYDSQTDIYLNDEGTNSLDPSEVDDDVAGIRLPDCLPCGNYFIIMVADYQNLVSESNKANNIYVFPFTTTGCVACSITIPPTGMNFQSAGGTGNISVATNQCCSWSATTTYPWINITTNSGTGNGTVNYTVTPCSGGGNRTGTILINGQSYSVTQNCTQSCNASQSFEWAAQAGSSTYSEYAYDLILDAAGNSYTTGSIQGSSSFGNGIILTTPSSATDIFVSKHNSLGQVQWAFRYGNTGGDVGNGIAKDNSGNIYVVGSFSGSITLGGITLTSNIANSDASFIVKLNSSGVVQWAKKINPSDIARGTKITIDNNDNIYVSGNLSDFSSMFYVAKYNTSGTQIWYQSYGSGNLKTIEGISADNLGNIFICGRFMNTLTLGSTTLTSMATIDGFISKLNSSGNPIWVKQLSSPGLAQNSLKSVAVDSSNYIYTIGNVDSTAMIDNIILPLSKGNKVVIIKYDQNGNPLWAKASQQGVQYPQKIAKANVNGIYFSGYFGNSMKLDTTTIVSAGTNDGFIVRVDENGKVIWMKGFGSAQADEAYTIASNSNSDVVVAGGFSGSVSYGNTTITSTGSIDIFLAKFKQCAPPVASIAYSGNLVLCPGQNLTFSTNYCSTNSYQWQLNNTTIPGANNPSYNATLPGSYKVKVIAFEGCETVSDSIIIKSQGTYTFTGTGNWDIASNWLNNTIPPSMLPSCYEIIIDPQVTGECILNVPQNVAQGKITVKTGKKLTVLGNLLIQ